jgi:hypothetical protein
MKKSYERPSNDEAMILQDHRADLLDLELPVAPDFVSLPPRRSLEEVLPWMEELRRWFPQSIPSDEQRLAHKVDVEFVL